MSFAGRSASCIQTVRGARRYKMSDGEIVDVCQRQTFFKVFMSLSQAKPGLRCRVTSHFCLGLYSKVGAGVVMVWCGDGVVWCWYCDDVV